MILGRPIDLPTGEISPELSEWLDLATHGLAPSAQARARAEIGAIYTKSLLANKACGQSEAGARAAALAELGDPQAGSRKLGLRLEHLTKFDTVLLAIRSGVQVFTYAILALLLVLFFHPKPLGAAVGLQIVLGCLVILVAADTIRRAKKFVASRQLVLLLALAWLNAGGFILLSFVEPRITPATRILEALIAFGLTLSAARITWIVFRRTHLRAMLGDSEIRLFREPEVPNLSTWLSIATDDFVPLAQARIQAEIEAHFTEAVLLKVAEGLAEAEAQAAALKDLGNPHVAWLRFSREHLTASDAKQVFSEVRTQVLMGTIWAFGPLAVFFWPNLSCLMSLLLVIPFGYVVYRVSRFVVRRSRQDVTRRTIFLLLSLVWLNIGYFIRIFLFDQSNDHFIQVDSFVMVFGLTLMAAVTSFRLLRLRKKLPFAASGNLPPLSPAGV